MQLINLVTVNVVVSDLPECDELTPDEDDELFGPEFAGTMSGMLTEGSIILILKGGPLGTEISFEKWVPSDGELGYVGGCGRV